MSDQPGVRLAIQDLCTAAEEIEQPSRRVKVNTPFSRGSAFRECAARSGKKGGAQVQSAPLKEWSMPCQLHMSANKGNPVQLPPEVVRRTEKRPGAHGLILSECPARQTREKGEVALALQGRKKPPSRLSGCIAGHARFSPTV